MKKVFYLMTGFLILMLLAPANLQAAEWEFSNPGWMPYSMINSPTTVDGLTVLATPEYPVQIRPDYKRVYDPNTGDGHTFTRKLDLQGSMQLNEHGMVGARAVSFQMDGPGMIIVASLASNPGEEASLVLTNGTDVLASRTIPSFVRDTIEDVGVIEFDGLFYNYEGGPTTIYIYSVSNAISLYYVGKEDPRVEVTFTVEVPANTKTVFVAGSFNGWDPGANEMEAIGENRYSLTVELRSEELAYLEYKYLSGPNWSYEELDAYGKWVPNRSYQPLDVVAQWRAVYDPSEIVSKNITFQIVVPFHVQNVFTAGNFNNWMMPDANMEMEYVGDVSFGKMYRKTVFVLDARNLFYKFAAGPGWEYAQTQDNDFFMNNPDIDTIRHNIFGFYQYANTNIQPNEWNFSKYPFLGMNQWINFTQNVNGLTMMADNQFPMNMEYDEKRSDQNFYYRRLKTNGAGVPFAGNMLMPQARALSFNVPGDAQIYFSALSDHPDGNRLYITNGVDTLAWANVPMQWSAGMSDLPRWVYNYQGPEATLYIFSMDHGVNIYSLGTTSFNPDPVTEIKKTFTVTVPEGTETVYIAGDFNGWSPNYHQLERINDRVFQITIWGATEYHGYKYLSGPDWQYRELNANGSEVENRKWAENDVVAQWAELYVPMITRVYFDDITAFDGEEITIPLKSFTNHPRTAISYQFRFHYDQNVLEYLGYDLTGTLSESGHLVANDTRDWGTIYFSYMNDEPFSITGDLLNLKFRVKNTYGSHWTHCSLQDFYFDDQFVWESWGGNVYIQSFMLGDVDGNYKVQAYDAALTLQYSVGKDPLPMIDPLPWEPWRIKAADVDGVDGITANDAALILQYSAYVIDSFPADNPEGMFKAPGESSADVSMVIEGNQLVIKSFGDLIGLNLYLTNEFDVLGTPAFSQQVDLSALNIGSDVYAIGLACIDAPAEGSTIVTIPLLKAPEEDMVFNLIINTRQVEYTVNKSPSSVNTFMQAGIALYPNPADQFIRISNVEKGSRIRIHDVGGRLLYSVIAGDISELIDLSGFANGVYTISVVNNDVTAVSKFVKQ